MHFLLNFFFEETPSSKETSIAPGEAGTPVRRIVHTAVYKQKLLQKNNTLKLYVFKSPGYNIHPLLTLRIQISSHNCHNCPNYPPSYSHYCSHLAYNYSELFLNSPSFLFPCNNPYHC